MHRISISRLYIKGLRTYRHTVRANRRTTTTLSNASPTLKLYSLFRFHAILPPVAALPSSLLSFPSFLPSFLTNFLLSVC